MDKQKLISVTLIIVILNLVFPQNATLKEINQKTNSETFSFQEKNIIAVSRLPEAKERKPRKTIYLTVTAYSSSRDETDGDPFTTASGARVKDGIIAHNRLPFGTKVRFPEVFGEKTFTVEDRLNPRHGQYIADIWMPSKQLAKQWGAKVLKMEIL